MQTDDVGALVRAATEGDKSAWNALVARFSGLVWSIARAHRLGAADAEDVYQTTWLRLMEHIGRIKEPDRVAGWLATTARREALKALHLGRRAAPVGDLDLLDGGIDEASPESAVVAIEDEAERGNRARRMWSALNALSERCRRLLRVLAASPPPSYAEVSDALGMPIGSIGPTRARCLERLRLAMAAQSAAPEVAQ
jgi:RNA polymerase sigma factor (sigma-70 family)